MGASNPPTYPPTTLSSDPYSKQLPLASSGYTAEPQELQSHLPTSMPSMPSMQLSLVASDQPGQQGGASTQVPPIRTQYAAYTSAATPSLSASAGGPGSLSVPRYVDVDTNPRPTKSPRHPSHPSIHGSISSTDSPSNNTNTEYRYGAPSAAAGPAAYGSISSSSGGGGGGADNNISPSTTHPHHHGAGQQQQQQQHHHHSAGGGSSGSAAYHHASPGAAHEGSSSGGGGAPSSSGSAAVQQQPPRDYYPSPASWTTTAGESSAPTYTNGDHRGSYPYSTDQYKTSGVKSDPHAPPQPVYPGQTMSHYSWNS